MGHYVTKALTIVSAVILLFAPTLAVYATGEQYFTGYSAPTASASPNDITVGPDGNLWFTERLARNIGRVTLNGAITEFPTPSDGYEENFPVAVTAGSDGAVWFTNMLGRNISRMTTNGTVTEYPIPVGSVVWSDVVTGSDGAVWFSNWFTGTGYNIGRIDTNGTITAFPTTQSYADVTKMTVGPDGALWMTRSSSYGSYISRMTMTGNFTEYLLPAGAAPKGITTGPDGALWFTEYGSNSIGTITTSGLITQYPLTRPSASPMDIIARPDGMLWFSEQSSNMLVSMTTDGVLQHEYTAPFSSNLQTLANAPDGNLWFADPGANVVGWFKIPAPVASTLTLTPTSATATVGTTTTFQAVATNTLGAAVAGMTVRYKVSGSTTLSGSCTTNTAGTCSFGYTGPQLPGADAVDAYIDMNGNSAEDPTEPSATATQAWMLPTATDGQVTGGGHIAGSTAGSDIAFGFVAKSDSKGVKGSCLIVDPAAEVILYCANATIMTVNGAGATIFGTAKINGETTLYRIDIQDVSTPGNGHDTFSIATQSGYRASGTLRGGNIWVH